MGFCQQFNALMRKNLLLKKRMYCTSIWEILLPVMCLLVMVAIRASVEVKENNPDLHLDYFPPRFVPPAYGNLSTYWETDDDQLSDFTPSMRNLAYKLLRRGHVISISPNVPPFCEKTLNTSSNVFSSVLAHYINIVAKNKSITPKEPVENSCSGSWYIRGYGSDHDVDNYAKDGDYPKDGYLETGVDFSYFNDDSFSYTIRANESDGDDGFSQQVPRSFIPKVDTLNVGQNTKWINMFIVQGFLPWQSFIDSWSIGKLSGDMDHAQTYSGLDFVLFPTPKYREDQFAGYTSALLPILFTLTFIWPVTRLVKQFVEEKELRIKEGLGMMGMTTSAHFLSWFATDVLKSLVMSLLIVLVTYGGRVYVYSSFVIIFLYFFFFAMCVFAFCWLVASFFSKATVGSTVSAILFLGAFLGSFGLNEETTQGQKVLACLSAPICFGLGAVQITTFESAQQGITFNNLGTEKNNFTMATCLGMLIFDFIFYLIIAVYAERVLPSEWGISLPPWFCCLPSYWCPRPPSEETEERKFDERYEGTDDIKSNIGIQIINLHKKFPNQSDDEAAVKKINLDMYEGQILALLGHNGAGKTTTINMITGMLPPSSGEATIYNYSINRDMPQIRQNLGVCPQHNILYDMLTVTEHLYLYARIKGVASEDIPGKVNRIIQEVGLVEKVNTFSKNLSGGMKRKLSVAIALIGGSRAVILDEPTSGMDPYSRRSTWEMLKQAKQNRVLVLTTHFMDEADQLGDRIAIMHRGQIKCCGSSLFLKSRYGVGYTLTIDKNDQADSKAIKNCVEAHVHNCKILSDVAGEISFQLPFKDSVKFPDMFDKLDENKADWGINSYGISVTTLEEVFLKVGHEADESTPEDVKREFSERMKTGEAVVIERKSSEGKIDKTEYKSMGDAENSLNVPLMGEETKENLEKDKLKGPQETWLMRNAVHFRALLAKRWHNAKRDNKVWLWQLLYPTLWLVAGIGLLQLAASLQGKKVSISVGDFNSPNYVPINYQSSGFLASVYDSNNAVFQNATKPEGNSVADSGCINTDIPINDTRSMSRFLLCNWKEYKESRYGAYILGQPAFNVPEVDTTILVNTTGVYTGPAFANLYNVARARQYSSHYDISLNFRAWPLTKQQQTLNQGLVSIIVAIAFAFVPASIVGFVVMERQTKSKHLQIISGVSTTAYWLANLFWDFLNFIPPCLIALAVFAAYDIDSLTGDAAGVLFMASILYALAVITFTYCVSFFFTNASTAQSIMLMVYIFTGCILLIASIILDIIPSTQAVSKDLKYIFRLVPSFSFGEIVIDLMTRDSVLVWGEKKEPTDFDIIGKPCLYLTFEFIVYLSTLLIIEWILATPNLYGMCFRPIQVEDEPFEDDEDVIKEKERIMSNVKLSKDHNNDMVVLKGLRKVYPGQSGPKVAVKDLWFGIPEGQCFGFLGINGAGKSSTLKMLTGDILPTVGTAELAGKDVLAQQSEVRKLIGYCPQFDALLPLMTARETLRMFARIKGMPSDEIEPYVENLCKQLSLDINGWLDKPCGGYSGGNKRKLSVGIALIGNPPIVFLDEPSTGMDPGSRRFMWNLISSTMAERSVVLTTHSMEECEALCSRLGIMVGGRLRCLGSSQHLKARYGSGYQLDAKLQIGKSEEFKKWITAEFKDVKLLELQGESVKYRVMPPKGMTLGKIFRKIENDRKTLGIVEYSVSETTLEQIFIHFAKQQMEETGPVAGLTLSADDANGDYKQVNDGTEAAELKSITAD